MTWGMGCRGTPPGTQAPARTLRVRVSFVCWRTNTRMIISIIIIIISSNSSNSSSSNSSSSSSSSSSSGIIMIMMIIIDMISIMIDIMATGRRPPRQREAPRFHGFSPRFRQIVQNASRWNPNGEASPDVQMIRALFYFWSLLFQGLDTRCCIPLCAPLRFTPRCNRTRLA